MALMRDGEVVQGTDGATEEAFASRVFSDLGYILGRAGMELRQIELFAVVTGPGSFTGLRVGLTAVKGWAEVLGRPIAGVSALEAIGAQAVRESIREGALLAPVFDARGGQLFGGLYRWKGVEGRLEAVGAEVVLSVEEYFDWVAAQAGGETPLFVTTTPEEEVSSELAPLVGRLGLAQFARGEVLDAVSLEANYVRRSDAEVKWRGA